ncbi:MAG: hypothetical protein LBL51_03480 [Synergistaceae bacterium]|jgi:hypothetical protein|nr:hypothetical protein [Synergistaceae bacterium]
MKKTRLDRGLPALVLAFVFALAFPLSALADAPVPPETFEVEGRFDGLEFAENGAVSIHVSNRRGKAAARLAAGCVLIDEGANVVTPAMFGARYLGKDIVLSVREEDNAVIEVSLAGR